MSSCELGGLYPHLQRLTLVPNGSNMLISVLSRLVPSDKLVFLIAPFTNYQLCQGSVVCLGYRCFVVFGGRIIARTTTTGTGIPALAGSNDSTRERPPEIVSCDLFAALCHSGFDEGCPSSFIIPDAGDSHA